MHLSIICLLAVVQNCLGLANFQPHQLIASHQVNTNTSNAAYPLSSTHARLLAVNGNSAIEKEKGFEDVDLPASVIEVLHALNSIIIAKAQKPFFYIKNILQLTLFAFLIHNILSLWILASLYYFLPNSPGFIKRNLEVMWRTYNVSTFEVFNIPKPALPKLNQTPSSLVYGKITISNDFFQFTLDPFCVLCVVSVNLIIFNLVRKAIRCIVCSRLKLSWLKFDKFQAISSILIELLPILFLPYTNFLFAPHFTSLMEKINLILFSAMGGLGVIFPFFCFSKLTKNKRHHKSRSFFSKKSEEIKQCLSCMLHLTIPVTILSSNLLPFFIINGLIMALLLVNSFFLKKKMLSNVLLQLYYFTFHICFILMHYCRENTRVFSFAGFIALGVIVACFVQEFLGLIYKVVKLFLDVARDCRKRSPNQICNQNQCINERQPSHHLQTNETKLKNEGMKNEMPYVKALVSMSQERRRIENRRLRKQKQNMLEICKIEEEAHEISQVNF